MDPSLDCKTTMKSELLKCIHVGLLCVQENPADRPSMLDVVVMLHGDDASSFAAPSKPAFTFGYCEQSSESVSAGDPPGTKTTADLHVPSSVNGMSVSEFKPR